MIMIIIIYKHVIWQVPVVAIATADDVIIVVTWSLRWAVAVRLFARVISAVYNKQVYISKLTRHYILGRCYAPRISGRTFLNRLCPRNFREPLFVYLLCPRICDSVIYFIHQMAIHNATKLLPLTNQTKLTLTVALTITDTVTVLF